MQCILCPYKNEEKCIENHDKCWSLSNIYHGYITKIFPFKQIDNIKTKRVWKKEEKYNAAMDLKYGDCTKEDDNLKFIWGITSWDDLSKHEACFYTMNDIDITYDKKEKKYMLGVETAYDFKNYEAACGYLNNCLNAFGKYMDDNGLQKNKPYFLFMNEPCTSMVADNIEDLYTNFKIFVDGYCNQDINMEEKYIRKE